MFAYWECSNSSRHHVLGGSSFEYAFIGHIRLFYMNALNVAYN